MSNIKLEDPKKQNKLVVGTCRGLSQAFSIAVILTTAGLFALSCQSKKSSQKKFVEDDAYFATFLNSLEFKELKMKKELQGKHPRLFFTKQDIPRIRKNATTTHAWFVTKIKENYGKYFDLSIPQTLMGLQESKKQGVFAWGWWRLMGLNLLYQIEQDKYYRDLAKKWVLTFCTYKDWGYFSKKVNDLASSDIMAGVAATYDILYGEFTPQERQTIRQALLNNMEMLYQSFLMKDKWNYWQHDYQNNHHWNRLHALLIASAAIYGEDKDKKSKYYLDFAYSQAYELLNWLPEDGTCHEGTGYWGFGHKYLIRLYDVLERLTGEGFFKQHAYFKNTMYFKLYMTTSNLKNSFYFSDSNPGVGASLYVFYRMASEFSNGHFQYYAERIREQNPKSLFEHTWGLLWYNPAIKPEPLTNLPLGKYYPDLDLFTIRESWNDNAAFFGIKCGVPGGHHMYDIRLQRAGEYKKINVAHDHPDQNHFIYYDGGTFWAEDDGYPKKRKLTSSHNTLLVDGKGQPKEGRGWYHAFSLDSTGFCKDVWHADNNGIFIGDASRCYGALDTYVRQAIFVNGEYVVLLDDIVGKGKHDYELRFHKDGAWAKKGEGLFRVDDGREWLGIRFLEPQKCASTFLPGDQASKAKPSLAVTIQQQEQARVVTVLVPTTSDIKKLNNATLQKEKDALIFSTFGIQTEDKVVYRLESSKGIYESNGIKGDFSNLIIIKDKKTKSHLKLLAMNCSQLSIDETEFLSSAEKINYSRIDTGDGVAILVDKLFKAKGKDVQLNLGGFKKGKEYIVAEKGKKNKKIKSKPQGEITLTAGLQERRVFVFRTKNP